MGTTLTTSRNVKYHLYLSVLLANVFSPKSIQDANPALRMAMEDVAGTAEKLAKDKAARVPPPQPFRTRVTPSIYSKIYAADGREARDRRAEQRRIHTTGIEKLGDQEYKRLLQEIDQMSQTPVDMEELINKRMKEISERLEAEEWEQEATEQRKTRSQDKPGTSKDTGSVPARRSSPRKRKAEPEDDLKKKTDPEPKIKPRKETDPDDASKSRKDKEAKRSKQSKTAAIPMIMDDDDDEDDYDLKIVDDKKDKGYEPEQEDDDFVYPMDDDDDDFQEPPPRARKSTTKKTTSSKKPMKATRVKESTKDADANDEMLSLFQRIVGPDFEIQAAEEFEEDPKDKCGNPVEAAGFRATMKMLALELMKAVKKGVDVEKAYTDMIRSTIEVTKVMKYPGATTVELKDILPVIKDMKCNAWRKFLKGETKMDPADIVMDDDDDDVAEDDLVIQGPILGKEATEAAAEAIHKLPPMLLANTKKQLKHLFEHTMLAHQHAAEASKCLKELHEKLPLDVFLRIADSAVRPLVVLHIPKTEQIIEKLKETAVQNTQRRRKQGSTDIKEVMVARNLPQCGKWTSEEEYRP